jgi:hypothetical protein
VQNPASVPKSDTERDLAAGQHRGREVIHHDAPGSHSRHANRSRTK